MGPCLYGTKEWRGRIGEERRERRRAEERKSIQIQREPDKPEQCIVQTHSITQSHVEAFTRAHTHTHTQEHPQRNTRAHIFIETHYKPHKALPPLNLNDIPTLENLLT